jgi:hypothetical protein
MFALVRENPLILKAGFQTVRAEYRESLLGGYEVLAMYEPDNT